MEESINKIKFILKEISKSNNELEIQELIENSEFNFENHWNQQQNPTAFNLNLKITPLIFTKNFNNKDYITHSIKKRINASTKLIIDKVELLPDYDKIVILNSEISIVETAWEEINQMQRKLIENIRISNHSIDYQNIGNTSRSIIDKLARNVFNPKIHIPENKSIELQNGKFKNQLHTYIKFVLKGKTNEELRKFAITAIDFTEKAIDLMNTTTHKLDAQKHFAEVCVISTISVVSLIKAVKEIE